MNVDNLKHLERSLFLVIILVLPSCNNQTEPALVKFRDFQHAIDASLCADRFRCCTPEEAAQRTPYKSTEAECIKAFDDAYDEEWGWVDVEVENGTLVYDPQVALECAQAATSETAVCAGTYDNSEFLAACSGLLTGTLPPKASCDPQRDRCADGFCEKIDDTTGTCRAFATKGEPCTAPCSPDLVCLSSGVCGPPAQPGQPCDWFLQCASWTCEANVCVALTVREALCQ